MQFATIRGIVKDRSTLAPLPNAVVRSLTNQVVDTTDLAGVFELADVNVGNVQLQITLSGYDTTVLEIIVREQSENFIVLLGGVEDQFLYIGTSDGHYIFIVDVDRLTVVSSVYVAEATISDFFITPGGSKLYVLPTNASTMFAFDTRTRTYSTTTIPLCSMQFAPWIGLVGFRNGVYLIDTLGNTASQVDSTTFYSPVLHPILPYIYALKGTPPQSRLFVYDWNAKQYSDSIELRTSAGIQLYPYPTAFTADGTKWFCVSENAYLGKYDVMTRTLSANVRVNRLGSIAITPDNLFVLVTDPGAYLIMEPIPSGLIAVVRAQDNQLDSYININPIAGENNITDRVVISRSGRYAFTGDWLNGVFVVDVRKKVGIKKFLFASDGQIVPLALGAKK